ncbi:hypothetical protein AURDEDRAFT_120072 [Auricularia subglabra TFB-10046 SS5]|nr:hypothetical protein AURDEDRAFT_120072 [Auricularia subglabra TFB-10046 SS5]
MARAAGSNGVDGDSDAAVFSAGSAPARTLVTAGTPVPEGESGLSASGTPGPSFCVEQDDRRGYQYPHPYACRGGCGKEFARPVDREKHWASSVLPGGNGRRGDGSVHPRAMRAVRTHEDTMRRRRAAAAGPYTHASYRLAPAAVGRVVNSIGADREGAAGLFGDEDSRLDDWQFGTGLQFSPDYLVDARHVWEEDELSGTRMCAILDLVYYIVHMRRLAVQATAAAAVHAAPPASAAGAVVTAALPLLVVPLGSVHTSLAVPEWRINAAPPGPLYQPHMPAAFNSNQPHGA